MGFEGPRLRYCVSRKKKKDSLKVYLAHYYGSLATRKPSSERMEALRIQGPCQRRRLDECVRTTPTLIYYLLGEPLSQPSFVSQGCILSSGVLRRS